MTTKQSQTTPTHRRQKLQKVTSEKQTDRHQKLKEGTSYALLIDI